MPFYSGECLLISGGRFLYRMTCTGGEGSNMGDFIECYYFASILAYGWWCDDFTNAEYDRVAQRNDLQDLSKHTSSM